MDARQRRWMVLPAPKGLIDKRDRYTIGIFYSFLSFITHLFKPLKTIFTACPDMKIFVSKKDSMVFTSVRKRA